MGLKDNLGKKASAAYDATAEKTSKIAKEAKLRMKINEDKSEINNIYKEIGKKVYCNAAGEILTATTDGAIELAATFASNKVVGIDLSDNTEVDAVLLDFPGGL